MPKTYIFVQSNLTKHALKVMIGNSEDKKRKGDGGNINRGFAE
jgi:hypothetical protein